VDATILLDPPGLPVVGGEINGRRGTLALVDNELFSNLLDQVTVNTIGLPMHIPGKPATFPEPLGDPLDFSDENGLPRLFRAGRSRVPGGK
jgi:hypothetical protein